VPPVLVAQQVPLPIRDAFKVLWMSMQEFSRARFAIFRLHGQKSSVIIRYFSKQGPVATGALGAS